MSKNVVVRGDKTNSGGEVISASAHYSVNDKQVALVDDLVNCPLDGHGVNPIVEGNPHRTVGGRAVVVDGCRCQCGCHVIASTTNSTVG
ncbi:PAAR domain-containing protein [Serratia marcescens]|nr:PAAR domain-containing protein [Serratia marcescens]MBS3894459.1 PAAR domain-containing protein [Serratia marcescens]